MWIFTEDIQANHIIFWLLILHLCVSQKNPFRFVIKIMLTDKLKFLDDKIKAIWAQYNLDREAAKISALSSK